EREVDDELLARLLRHLGGFPRARGLRHVRERHGKRQLHPVLIRDVLGIGQAEIVDHEGDLRLYLGLVLDRDPILGVLRAGEPREKDKQRRAAIEHFIPHEPPKTVSRSSTGTRSPPRSSTRGKPRKARPPPNRRGAPAGTCSGNASALGSPRGPR